ncbi:hypothetical protein H4P12_01700 [Paracoccus sp. 11-3]|uniref:Uncharacterized protein n=1 Tax=Paracoccus amoyensis TaxID=2760093 RepID=A0A926G8W6_9RHOB|nr:hypothetical protein [Paracoccus amoyensis]MBC9245451.1 hypothetical protein [Paracoccus amoyensis]
MLGRFLVVFFVIVAPLKAQPEDLRHYVLTFENSPILQAELSGQKSIRLAIQFSLIPSMPPYELIEKATLTDDTWKATISLTHQDSPERWASIREICIDISKNEIPNSGFLFNTRCRPLFEISANNIQQPTLIDQRTLLNTEQYYAEQEQSLLELIEASSPQQFREKQIEEKIRNFFEGIPENLIGDDQIKLYARMIRFANSNQLQLNWTDYYSLRDENNNGPIKKISNAIRSNPDLASPLLGEYLLVDFDKQATISNASWALDLLDSISYLTIQSLHAKKANAEATDASDLLELAEHCENYRIKSTTIDLTKFKYRCLTNIKEVIQTFYNNADQEIPGQMLEDISKSLESAFRLTDQQNTTDGETKACALVKKWRLNNRQLTEMCNEPP